MHCFDLDGQVLVIDREAQYWVRFVVRRVAASEARPHGLNFADVPGPDGERLVGFDNAHPIRARSGPADKSPAPSIIGIGLRRGALRIPRRGGTAC